MIYVDNRIGSKELYPLFPPGVAELTRMHFGDFMIVGHHADGDILVGIERKRIGDFINSMCSGRLSGKQLIGLLNSYHYIYLVIEGEFRAHPKNGVLQVRAKSGYWYDYKAGARRFMARDIWAFMNTLQVVCGLHCYHCSTPTDTAYYLMALRHWWMKEYGEHRGHLQPNSGTTVQLSKHSLVRRVAAQLDGIGWGKAKAIDERMDTVEGMVVAGEADYMAVEGIGKKLAGSIVKQLRGGK